MQKNNYIGQLFLFSCCITFFCIPVRKVISSGSASKNRQEHDWLQVSWAGYITHSAEKKGFSYTYALWGFPTVIPGNRGTMPQPLQITPCHLGIVVSYSLLLSASLVRFQLWRFFRSRQKLPNVSGFFTWVKRVGKFLSMEFVATWGHPCCFHVLLWSPCPRLDIKVSIFVTGQIKKLKM